MLIAAAQLLLEANSEADFAMSEAMLRDILNQRHVTAIRARLPPPPAAAAR